MNKVLVSASGIACSLAIDSEMKWTIRVGVSACAVLEESALLHGYPPIIGCFEQVIQILKRVDGSAYCVGSSNAKFTGLVDRHKGIFKDGLGKHTFDYTCYALSTIYFVFLQVLKLWQNITPVPCLLLLSDTASAQYLSQQILLAAICAQRTAVHSMP